MMEPRTAANSNSEIASKGKIYPENKTFPISAGDPIFSAEGASSLNPVGVDKNANNTSKANALDNAMASAVLGLNLSFNASSFPRFNNMITNTTNTMIAPA